ncbi:RNA polymerase sigma factor [Dethiothermospora halolimnae]|uniref:RNA polymerase sigma factor n=1 Tax=Dethiothermospora halolimnae TaxID=3114390 RepID=UPI003CCBF763
MNIYLVYEKYNRDFIAYAKSITKNKDKALDLVQDAYISAIEREEIFNVMNEYQIKGWFFTTIKNKNIDNIRKGRKMTYLDNEEIFGGIETFEEKLIMKEVLNKLPKKNKEVLVLKYEMNLNSREIGKILKISPSTVRSRLSKSLELLKNIL